MAVHSLSLCSGVAGIELGLELLLPGGFVPVCYVEREISAANILAAHIEAGQLPSAPIWTDVRSVCSAGFRDFVGARLGGGRLGLITGGYPCQPFSLAGKRLGANDPRHLWPAIAEAIGLYQPDLVFFENVAGHLQLGFGEVRRDLEDRGYRVQAGLFTAGEVGAPHKRQRLFILGVADSARDGWDRSLRETRSGGRIGETGEWIRVVYSSDCNEFGECPFCGIDYTDCGCPGPGEDEEFEYSEFSGIAYARPLADASAERLQRLQQRGAFGERNGAETSGSTPELHRTPVGDSAGERRGERGTESVVWSGGNSAGGGSGTIPVFPPKPGDIDGWRRLLDRCWWLAPALGDDCLNEATEPAVRRMVDGLASRVDRLRACGNGVVPLEAAAAFLQLFALHLFPEEAEPDDGALRE